MRDVADGAEAVREYAAAHASGLGNAVVIFHLTVPGGLGGVQALNELRRLDPFVQAIVSSEYSGDPLLADCRELGFSATVARLFEVATLLETVGHVLEIPARVTARPGGAEHRGWFGVRGLRPGDPVDVSDLGDR